MVEENSAYFIANLNLLCHVSSKLGVSCCGRVILNLENWNCRRRRLWYDLFRQMTRHSIAGYLVKAKSDLTPLRYKVRITSPQTHWASLLGLVSVPVLKKTDPKMPKMIPYDCNDMLNPTRYHDGDIIVRQGCSNPRKNSAILA
jgi:hypothetical protein